MALTYATLVDLNANELILDLDADTSITADSDDTIDFKIGGSDEIKMTTTALTPATADGSALGTAALEWSDLYLADSSVIYFGADQDTTLVHTDGSGLTLNSTNKLMFNDASQYIQGASATVLNIVGDAEVDITTTLLDINANVEISGTTTQTGVATFSAVPVFPNDTIETADIQDNAVSLAKMAGLARGKIIYGNASGDPAALAVGSSGQVITTDGTDISWGSGFNADAAQVFNESGANVDFRIESDTNANMFFVKGGNDRIGIGTNSPDVQVEMVHATEPRLRLRNTATPDGTKYGGIIDLQLGEDGASGSGHSDTQDGDVLGIINFVGQGTDYAYQGAGISAEVETGDGTATRTEQGVGLNFYTMPTTSTGYAKRWRIDQDGDLIPANTAHGIVLGATTNSDVNTLDDYEEGTWTPTRLVNTSVTVGTVHTARYTKIGNLVTIVAAFAVAADDPDSGDVRFGGFPFSLVLADGGFPVQINYNYKQTPGIFLASNGYVYYQNTTVGGNNQEPFGSALHSAQVVSFTFSYVSP